MKAIKYSQTAVCPNCGGMLSYDATMKERLPVGLGFAPNSSRFQIDVLERKGWRGQCMECQTHVFAVVSQRHLTRFPKAINAKIQAAQDTV